MNDGIHWTLEVRDEHGRWIEEAKTRSGDHCKILGRPFKDRPMRIIDPVGQLTWVHEPNGRSLCGWEWA